MWMVSSKSGEEQVSIKDSHERQFGQEDSFKYFGSMVDIKGQNWMCEAR